MKYIFRMLIFGEFLEKEIASKKEFEELCKLAKLKQIDYQINESFEHSKKELTVYLEKKFTKNDRDTKTGRTETTNKAAFKRHQEGRRR